MDTGVIEDSTLLIKPSRALCDYINSLETSSDMPIGIKNLRSKNKLDTSNRICPDFELLITEKDKKVIASLNLSEEKIIEFIEPVPTSIKDSDRLLNLEDLHWLRDRIVVENTTRDNKVYLHNLFQTSDVILPKNKEIIRNPDLEKRCVKLRAQQANMAYKAMTKNVDNVRHRFPEDTIAFQMKQINTHLIAVAQFIVSVLAGFAFGFIGVELMIGNLDFGFRLLLGIMCALIIALAELYFLAKKLNEDLEYELNPEAKLKERTKIE